MWCRGECGVEGMCSVEGSVWCGGKCVLWKGVCGVEGSAVCRGVCGV